MISKRCRRASSATAPSRGWLVKKRRCAGQSSASAALRTGQRFGAGHLIDLLRGKVNDKMRDYGHDTLPTFGVGRELDDAGWRSVFRQLLAAGYLESDVHAYGAIRLTETARPLLKGEQALTLRRSALRAGSARAPRTGAAATSVAAEDASLYAALRAWRAERAREQGVPAYVIAVDRTLAALAAQRPERFAELMDIPGVGQAKAERYGEAWLEIVAEHAAD